MMINGSLLLLLPFLFITRLDRFWLDFVLCTLLCPESGFFLVVGSKKFCQDLLLCSLNQGLFKVVVAL